MKKNLLLVLAIFTLAGCAGNGNSTITPTTSANPTTIAPTTAKPTTVAPTTTAAPTTVTPTTSQTPSTSLPKTYRFEFEENEMIDVGSSDPLRVEAHDDASNGACVAYFREGDIVRFTFNATEADTNVALTVCASSTKGYYDTTTWELLGIYPIAGTELNNICYLNNFQVTGWQGQFEGSGAKDTTGKYPVATYHNFTTVSTYISLNKGTNVLEFRGNNLSFNWDYIELTTTKAEINSDTATEVVKGNEVDVYFIAGQSNAAGCSDFYRKDLKTLNLSEKYASKADRYVSGFENVYYYGKAYDTVQTSYTNFNKLTPVKACMGITTTHDFGAELGMAEYLNSYYAGSEKKAVIIKYAVCASAMLGNSGAWGEWSTPSYPNPSLNGEPNLYDLMFGTNANSYNDGLVYDALNEIVSNGFTKINYKGFYWSQGESDTWKVNTYDDVLTAFINDVRRDVNNIGNTIKSQYNVQIQSSSDLPFLISEIAPTQGGATKLADGTSSDDYINKTVENQRKVASSMNKVATLPTDEYDIINQSDKWASSTNDGISYCADPWHYNGDDMLEIGNLVGESLYGFNEKQEVTVTFDVNGCPTTIEPQTVKLNHKAKKPETPKFHYENEFGKEYDFVFENWYNGETVWNFDEDVVTQDITLRANWTLDDSYFDFDPNASVRAENTTARIMSFNVLADDWNNKPAVDDTRANQGFNTVERYQPDVVGLQEFDDQWYNQAKKFLDGYTIVNANNNKIGTATNYSTLAYNSSKVKLIEYGQESLFTYDSPNVCRNVTIGVFEFIQGENSGKQFMVSSTHWDLTEEMRIKQASELVQKLKVWEAKYPELPLLMTGDFNTREETTSYSTFMTEGSYIDTKWEALDTGITGNSIHLGTPMRTGDRNYKNPDHIYRGSASLSSANLLNNTCIDHIFATSDVTSLYHSLIIDEDALGASDHAPIYSDVRF